MVVVQFKSVTIVESVSLVKCIFLSSPRNCTPLYVKGVRVTISLKLAGTPMSNSTTKPVLTGVLLITFTVSNSIPLPARQDRDSRCPFNPLVSGEFFF